MVEEYPRVIFCNDCFEFLQAKGELVLTAWLDVCCDFIDLAEPKCIHQTSIQVIQILNYLEQLGYIVTHETDCEFLAKPLGLQYLEDDKFKFCINNAQHKD